MLEVSQSGTNDWLAADCQPKERFEESKLKEKAAKLCRDYLSGAWLSIQPSNMILKKVRYPQYTSLHQRISNPVNIVSPIIPAMIWSGFRKAAETLKTFDSC